MEPENIQSKVAIKSLKVLCEEMLERRSMKMKSLQEICSEVLRELLCGKVDTQLIQEKLKENCHECGPGIHVEEKESYLIGSDVVALFPSIKSRNTGVSSLDSSIGMA